MEYRKEFSRGCRSYWDHNWTAHSIPSLAESKVRALDFFHEKESGVLWGSFSFCQSIVFYFETYRTRTQGPCVVIPRDSNLDYLITVVVSSDHTLHISPPSMVRAIQTHSVQCRHLSCSSLMTASNSKTWKSSCWTYLSSFKCSWFAFVERELWRRLQEFMQLITRVDDS